MVFMTPATVARAAGRRVLGENSPAALPAFRRLVLAQALNVGGYWIYLTAVFNRVVDELGGGTAQTSRITAIATLPLIFVAPFAGLMIDKLGPKTALLGSYTAAGVVLTLASLADSYAGFYVAAAALAFAVAVLRPAVFGMLNRTVPSRLLAQGNGVLFAASEASIIIGPLASQVVIRLVGTDAAFLLAGTSLIMAAVVLRKVPAPPPVAEITTAGWRARLRELAAGARSIRSDSSSRVAMLCIVTLFMFIGALISLEPSLISDEIGARNSLGWVYASAGVGSCTSSLLVARLAYPRRPLPRIGIALTVLGVTTIAYALASSLAVAVVVNFTVGLAFGWVAAPSFTVLQQRSPVAVVGRTMAAVTIAQQASQGVAALTVGQFGAEHVRIAVAVIGVTCIAIGAGVALLTWRRVEPPGAAGSPLAGDVPVVGDAPADLTAEPGWAGTPTPAPDPAP